MIIFTNFSYGQLNDIIDNAITVEELPYIDLFSRTDLAYSYGFGDMNGCAVSTLTRVYYKYTPLQNESIMVAIAGGNSSNSFVVAYESSVENATDDSQLTLHPDSACNLGDFTSVDLIAGQTYYFVIGNRDTASHIVIIPNSSNNIINIPDQNLKNKLLNQGVIDLDGNTNSGSSIGGLDEYIDVDLNNDGEIQESEALFVTYLDVSSDFSDPDSVKIEDLTGIEYFINLEYLNIDNNRISSLLGISNNSLKTLRCNSNNFYSIDVTGYLVLEDLSCGNNSISNIDVTQNISLKSLALDNNPITEVDITKNIFLEEFSCIECQLTSLDVTQALNLRTLFISDNQLSFIDLSQNTELTLIFGSRNNFTTFDVSNNLKLNYWSCWDNPLTEIDVSNNVLLETLYAGNNEIISLDLTQNPNLRRLTCYSNNLTELDTSQNPVLEDLSCNNNLLTSLDVSQNPVLLDLVCHTNQLTSLDVTQNTDLRTLRLGSNPIQQIDVSQNTYLTHFNSYGTSIINLDLSQNPNLNIVRVGNNYNLQSLNLKNGNNTNILSEDFNAVDSPNLHSVCVDDINYAVSNFTNKEPLTFFVDDCSQNTISYNIIEGELTLDELNNGCDPTDPFTPNVMITTTDGTNKFSTFTDDSGSYRFALGNSTYDTTVMTLPDFITASPVSQNTVFTDFSNTEIVDFCLTSTSNNVSDLEIIVLPVTEARPGFLANYRLVYKNKGITTLNGTVTFQFDGGKQSFVSAIPVETEEFSNIISFDFSDLKPFESRNIDIKMSTFAPPTTNDGDLLSFIASIAPTEMDQTIDDNTYYLEQIAINSYDPNDKQVLQGAEIYVEKADEYLDYLIRFQNTGTASAINVRITDRLNEKLDWNTIQPISASHSYRTQITNGDFVEFIFDNINLPAEQNDPEGSNGFVAFKIKPNNDVKIGDIINGEANIYFDFNPPIITNLVSTEIIETLGVEENIIDYNKFVLYPNPARSKVHIETVEDIYLIKIIDIHGRVLKTIKLASGKNNMKLNIEDLIDGVYFLEVSSALEKQIIRMIKK